MINDSNDKAVRGKEAAEILGISLAMVYKLMTNDRQFPKGKKLGKVRVWLKSDLLSYLGSKEGK